MSLIDSLTPKDTEEMRPGLFIQKKGDNYKEINPVAWNGQWRLRKQFGWRNLFFIILVVFISWSYYSNTEVCAEFQADPCPYLQNLTTYCMQKSEEGSNTTFFDNVIIRDDATKYPTGIQDNP